MTLIYIADSLVDLFPDTKIAISIQRVDVNNPSARYVSRTNEISLPLTANNLSIFEIESDKSYSTKVYTVLDCRVVQNGYELIGNGRAFCTKVEGYMRVQIYDTDVDYFQSLKDINVYDLLLSTGNGYTSAAYTTAGIAALRNTTTGIVTAYCDWGRGFDTNYHLPFFYYRNLILALANKLNIQASDIAGAKMNADIGNMAFTLANSPLEYNTKFKDLYNIVSTNSTEQFFLSGFPAVVFATDSVISQGSVSTHNGAEIAFPSPVGLGIDWITIELSLSFRMAVSSAVIGDDGDIALVRDRGGVITVLDSVGFVAASSSFIVEANINVTINVQSGDKFKIKWETVPGVRGRFYANEQIIRFTPVLTPLRNYFFFNNFLPLDVTADDILKDWVVRFGVVFKTLPTGQLAIRYLQEILSDVNGAIDWSNKKARDQSVVYKPTFANNNYYKYANDTKSNGQGRGNITVFGDLLQQIKTVFTSVFNSCVTRFNAKINSAYFQAYDATSTSFSDVKKEIPLTLVKIRTRNTLTEPFKNYNGNVGDYRIAYFEDPLYESTSFTYFLDKYYPILQDALQNNKLITRYYNLNDKDIFDYDPFKMIYDNGEYYLVNKIENYVSGQLTKVELLRI
jgi:hypothetical protein